MGVLNRWVGALILAVGINFVSQSFANVGIEAKKKFESIVQRTMTEDQRCKHIRDSLKTVLNGSLVLRDKAQAFALIKVLQNYTAIEHPSSEMFWMVLSEKWNKVDQQWAIKQAMNFQGCPAILIRDASRVLSVGAIQLQFSEDELKQLDKLLVDIGRVLLQGTGPLLNGMVASDVFQRTGLARRQSNESDLKRMSREYSQALDEVRRKLSQGNLGIRVNEPSFFASYLLQELKESERLRVLYSDRILKSVHVE